MLSPLAFIDSAPAGVGGDYLFFILLRPLIGAVDTKCVEDWGAVLPPKYPKRTQKEKKMRAFPETWCESGKSTPKKNQSRMRWVNLKACGR